MNDTPIWKKIKVERNDVRMDVWLAATFHQLSRRGAQGFAEQGNVLVNGRAVGKNYRLNDGDWVDVLKEPAPRNWRPKANEGLSLDVVHEEAGFVVVNKPWRMPSTAISPDDHNTLANAIVARYPECAGIGMHNGDAGLLHRLDNDTSGLLIAARTVRAHKALKIMQESNQIEKRYHALVGDGANVSNTLNAPLTISVSLDAKHKGGKKMAAVRGGQKAVTHVEEVTLMGAYNLVKILIFKGVRHQIRVHLAQYGYPICGDEIYGTQTTPGLNRLFLHAAGLRFFHPETGAPVEVHCPLPIELQRVVSELL